MGLRQKLHLELEDGTTLEPVYDGRDLRAWETKHGKSSLVGPMSLSQLTWLGWAAAKREGSINGQFDRYEAFDAQCVEVRGMALDATSEESPDPTQSDPSGG